MVSPLLPPFTSESFAAKPLLECDVVMKGGITSGVIYPAAVCQLAQTYRLRSVGGASAGAIAAAAAAAAEVGRQSGADSPGSGFSGLASFPDQLTKPQADGRSLLFHLFSPQPGGTRLFAVLTDVLDVVSTSRASTPDALARLVRTLLVDGTRAFPQRAAAGALAGGLVHAAALAGLRMAVKGRGPADARAVAGALALPAALVGAAVGVGGAAAGIVSGLLNDFARLPALGFGLSNGMLTNEQGPALTPWLHGQLQRLAGRTTADAPLTFGDLEKQGVELKVMTTNLNRAQPLTMPWPDTTYFFRETEFRDLFPAEVVEAMVKNPPALPAPSDKAKRHDTEVHRAHARELGYLPLPDPTSLPILVATRMSLSFPVLIAAVPLYAVDHSLDANNAYSQQVRQRRHDHPHEKVEDAVAGVAARPTFDVNWFSDGGLTNNLPVNFFDSPLPGRPTFAIDLAAFDDETRSTDESQNSYLPPAEAINSGQLARRTARWQGGGLRQVASFLGALFGTARTWVDEAQLTMPGYRDRVVTVYQTGAEGGLNLTMDKTQVDALSMRGRCAAAKLVSRFTEPIDADKQATGWDNQRWIRFRTATAGVSEWLSGFEAGFAASEPAFERMLSTPEAQPSYRVEGDRLAAARRRVQTLRTEIAAWAQDPADAFTASAPKPVTVLRIVPGDPKPEGSKTPR